MKDNIKIIASLGPATNKEEDLMKMKDKGVDFVRINMSHSSVEDLKYFIDLAKKVGIDFIVDTEGSQIRTGELDKGVIEFSEGDVIKIHNIKILGNDKEIYLKPEGVINKLDEGDLIFVDFDTLVLRVSDNSTIDDGYVSAKIVTSGALGSNKSAVVVSAGREKYDLPVLTDKDLESIDLALKEGIGHIAVSFVRKGVDVDVVKSKTSNAMYIISKIEAKESLFDLDNIIDKSDALLLDRGDLSKEIPIEKLPLVQKIVLKKAREKGKPVFIATNLLESMIENKKPTRAEVNDVMNTIIDGASGLILSAETAIGKNPMSCINMLNKLVKHSKLINDIDHMDYFSDVSTSSLIEPHGGRLVDRMIDKIPIGAESLFKVELTKEQQMDIEQIAIGTFSPLEGFMNKGDFESVLDDMKLKNGVAWTIPIVLDVDEEEAKEIELNSRVALVNENREIIGILHVCDKYTFNKRDMIKRMYFTEDENHPGVRTVMDMKPILIGGKIDLISRKGSEFKEHELTPKQVRRLFEDRGWVKIVGFHTRNVIHRGHEFIQLDAMNKENCDGLFVHPVIGKKKSGDFNSKYIIESYEKMMKDFYPKNRVVFATFSTFSRYAGPREAVFTAICRKNFGCSHFIVGRDHTGVGSYYHPNASHQIFSKFPDLGIKPVIYDKVFYSDIHNKHIHEKEMKNHPEENKLHVSGTEARSMFERGERPPEWFMRPEIAEEIIGAIGNGEEVFVE
jgi:ATP sulfurylase